MNRRRFIVAAATSGVAIVGGAALLIRPVYSGTLDAAIDKLLASIAAFVAHSGPLQPHFAYGQLSKSDYESAHVMHFLNHMSEITVQSQ